MTALGQDTGIRLASEGLGAGRQTVVAPGGGAMDLIRILAGKIAIVSVDGGITI